MAISMPSRSSARFPQSVLYDNDRCLVAKILPDGTRKRASLFSGFLSHDLIWDRYGRPGKGNDKGNVEGLVGYSRRNFMVPMPEFATWDAFNLWLEAQCRKRQRAVLRGESETIGERLQRDLAAMRALSKTGAELLFELISQRYERGSTLITSNLPFDEWIETFGSERLTGALLDRQTHHISILEMNGESYPLANSTPRKRR